MLEYSKKYMKDVDHNWVKKKIQNLRIVFKKEVNRVEESKSSGKVTDELYLSPLWYYDLLTFTLEQPAMQASSEMMTSQDGGEDYEEELVFSPEEDIVSLNHVVLPWYHTFPIKILHIFLPYLVCHYGSPVWEAWFGHRW